MQEDSTAIVDTVSQAYADKWAGAEGIEQTGVFVQFMSSNDLIFVVLGVSLIIWFILLMFIIRLDKKVTKLENEITN